MNKPLFSIITVTYNCKDDLEKTVKSVSNQVLRDFEHIIIDGKSTDGTVDVIKKYGEDIDYCVSEKDKGIYDAMNKGVKASKGELLFFLNAGDIFYDNKVLEEVRDFYINNNKPSGLYGGINYINPIKGIEYEEIIKEEIDFKKIKMGKMIRHQSLFLRKDVFERTGMFDLEYGLGGDYEFECRLFLEGIKCVYFDRVIANFYGGGAGGNLFKAYKVKAKIIKDKFGKFNYIKYLLIRGICVLGVFILKKLGILKRVLIFRARMKQRSVP